MKTLEAELWEVVVALRSIGANDEDIAFILRLFSQDRTLKADTLEELAKKALERRLLSPALGDLHEEIALMKQNPEILLQSIARLRDPRDQG